MVRVGVKKIDFYPGYLSIKFSAGQINKSEKGTFSEVILLFFCYRFHSMYCKIVNF